MWAGLGGRVAGEGGGKEEINCDVSMAEVSVFRGEATWARGGGGSEGEGGVQYQWARTDCSRGRGCYVACAGSWVEAQL